MKFRVYLKPFDDAGNYQSDYQEITDDVVSLGNMSWLSDSNDFDIGVFRNAGFNILMRNDRGKYSDPTSSKSIFRYKRNETQVKVTWDRRDYDLTCGFFQCGYEEITDEEIVFEGLIEDIVSSSNIDDQNITFKVLGFESLFDKVVCPFNNSSLDGDYSDKIFEALNLSKITSLLTLDIANILPAIDDTTVDIASLEGKSVKEALDELLLISASVLIISDRVIYVKDREATPDIRFSFYGQGSVNGLENIINITNLKDGLAKAFNNWQWGNDNEVFSIDLDYVVKNGLIKKQIQSDILEDPILPTSQIQDLLDFYLDEFKDEQTEFELETPIEYEQLYLRLYDRVVVDYPTVYVPSDDKPLPRYGQNYYGQARYPFGKYALTIPSTERFKILGRRINTAKNTITFSLRRI